MGGFAKLTRCLLTKPIFQNEKILKIWIWCLLKATHTEHEQMVGLQKVTLQPGQFPTGRYAGAKELGLNPSTFWKYMLWLRDNESLDIKSNNKYSLVTVANWGFYQGKQEKSDSKSDSKMTTKCQQNDTNKKDKKEKNEVIATYTVNPLLIEAIESFIEMRRKIKKEMTDYALKLMLNKLTSIASTDTEKIEILNRSTMSCYQGIFPISDQYSKQSKKGGESEINWV